MAYRTYINGNEWLGNNEYSEEIFDELKRQGCPFDEDYLLPWNEETHKREAFEVKDLDGLVKATEKYILNMFEKNNNIANFTNDFNLAKKVSDLTFSLKNLQECAYIFASVQLLNYVGKDNYTIDYENDEKHKKVIFRYKLKENAKCIFTAY